MDIHDSQPSTEVLNNSRLSSPPMSSSRPVSPSVLGYPLSGRQPCNKVLRGQLLLGQHSVYDIDMPHPEEASQHLDDFPISVYGRDLASLAGRQIAVNRRYICYCLRPGSIRILSRNAAIRALFQGHSQKVTDMSFFSDNVHLLASASSDGRILIWKVSEGLSADGTLQLSEQTLLAMQIIGEWKDANPHVCWHPHSQGCLFVGINRHLLRIDINEVEMSVSSTGFTAENPLKCHIVNLFSGVECFGIHDDEITDLSAVWKDGLCIASASKDGTVKIWGEKKMITLSNLVPHEGEAVSSVVFISAPSMPPPNHTVLLTGGSINSKLKLWVPDPSKGSLPGNSWSSVQTLELKSSSEGKAEDAFLNHLCVVQQAGIILLGNAKRHAMYSIHLEFGSTAAATHMDYFVEFSMTMPILSLTAMAESVVGGKGSIQVFCVQTQLIQQYFLNVSFCIPSQEVDSSGMEKSDVSNISDQSRLPRTVELVKSLEESSVPNVINSSLASEQSCGPDSSSGFGSWVEVPNWVAATFKKSGPSLTKKQTDVEKNLTPPQSPLASISRTSSVQRTTFELQRVSEWKPSLASTSIQSMEFRAPVVETSAVSSAFGQDSWHMKSFEMQETSVDWQLHDQHPTSDSTTQCSLMETRLITPSELIALALHRSSNMDFILNNQLAIVHDNNDLQLDTNMGDLDAPNPLQLPSDICLSMKHTNGVPKKNVMDGNSINHDSCILEINKNSCKKEDNEKDTNAQVNADALQRGNTSLNVRSDSITSTKKRRNKNKNKSAFNPYLSTPGIVLSDDTTLEQEAESNLSETSSSEFVHKLLALQESFCNLVALQKGIQKQISIAVETPMAKETKRVESAIKNKFEEILKACSDALWARMEDDNKRSLEFQDSSMQQLSSLITNVMHNTVPINLNQILKNDVTPLGPVIADLITVKMQSDVTATIHDNFLGLREKVISELQKLLAISLENHLSHQLQSQFSAFSKHLLQDELSSHFEESMVPLFDSTCRNMLERVNVLVHEQMIGLAFYAEEQLTASCLALASKLMDAMLFSLSSIQSMKGVIVEGQRRLLTFNEDARFKSMSLGLSSQSSGDLKSKVQALHYLDSSLDAKVELSILLRQGRFEEAFTMALSLGSISIVSWLCMQVDPKMLFSVVPLPLSQRVIFSLMQQLGFDLGKDSMHKLIWIQISALALDLNDRFLGPHLQPLLQQLLQNLQRQIALFNSDIELSNQSRLVMHLLNSLLISC